SSSNARPAPARAPLSPTTLFRSHDRDVPREARHRVPRRIERRHLNGRADRRARHGIRWLYREGELRGGAWSDIERGTGHGRDPTGTHREGVTRTGLVHAQIEEGGHATHRRHRRRTAEGRTAGIVPQCDGDRAGESRRDVTE